MPLTDLLHKDQEWQWGAREQDAFDTLRNSLITAPVLRLADPNREFRIETDASCVGIGAVLLQEDDTGGWHPVAYESKKLLSREKNYPIYEKELLALIYGLVKWRHYVYGRHIRCITDHRSLVHLPHQQDLRQRQAGWVAMMQEYQVTIEYTKGCNNIVADTLSRRPDYAANSTSMIRTDISQVTVNIERDEHFGRIRDHLLRSAEERDPALVHWERHYYLDSDGVLRYEKDRVCVPIDRNTRRMLLEEHHDIGTSGHLGANKTYLALSSRFYWPNMQKDVREYINSCPSCQANKADNQQPAGLLHSLEVPAQP